MHHFFHFSSSEQRGLWILCLLLCGAFLARFLPYLIFSGKDTITIEDEPSIRLFLEEQQRIIDSLQQIRNQRKTYYDEKYWKGFADSQESKLHPFAFNPDTMQVADWKRVGFSDKQAAQIFNYIAKIGGVKNKEILQKIYCISPKDYLVLEPYIQLTVRHSSQAQTFPVVSPKQIFKVELNTADSIALLKIPGIGSKTAARIIDMREKLGGFHSLEQLREIYYFLDSNRFAQVSYYLTVDKELIKHININTAEFAELNKHYHIDAYLAKSIIVHRQKIGKFQTVSDLKKAARLPEELYQKLLPYLRAE